MQFPDLKTEAESKTGLYTIDAGKVVLPDECGDTLWDEVLAQNNLKTVDADKLEDTI